MIAIRFSFFMSSHIYLFADHFQCFLISFHNHLYITVDFVCTDHFFFFLDFKILILRYLRSLGIAIYIFLVFEIFLKGQIQ